MNDEFNISADREEGVAVAASETGTAVRDRPSPAGPREAPEPLTHGEKRLIVISMMLPIFLGSIDQSILASALPTIGRVFGDAHDLPWLITAFLISSTAMTPLYGKFADIHGRRATLLIAVGIYMAGSVVSALSTSMLMLICGRVVQGFGGAGLTTSAQMVLGDIAAPKDRAKYYIYFSAAFTTAGGCGPALGGWICDHLYWWAIFVWQIPLCVVALLFTLTMLRRLPRYGKPHQLDFVGAFLIMAASTSFMLALSLGGVRYPWLSLPVLALTLCAVLLGAAFVLRLLTASEPLIPIAILSDPIARLAILVNSLGWGSIIGLNIFLPMFLQSALGWSATQSGLNLMVLMISLNASAGLSSQLIGNVRRYKMLPLCFLFVAVGAIVALAFSVEHMAPLRLQILMAVIGIGFGPTAPLTQVILQNTVAVHHLGSAISTMNFARTLFGTILVALFGAMVLAGAPPAGSGEVVNQAIPTAAPVAAFAKVFLATAAILGVALIALVVVEEKPLAATMPPPRS